MGHLNGTATAFTTLWLGMTACNGTTGGPFGGQKDDCTRERCTGDAAPPVEAGHPIADSGAGGGEPSPDASSPPASDAAPGDASDAPPPDGAPSFDVAAFCEALFVRTRAWTALLRDCCASPHAESAAILRNLLATLGEPDGAIAACTARFTGLAAKNAVGFEPAHSRACTDAFNATMPEPPSSCPAAEGFDYKTFLLTLGHEVPVFEQLPECRRLLSGRVPEQGSCTDVFECEAPLICPSEPRFGLDAHICQKPGSACVRSADCPADSLCTGASQKRCTKLDAISDPGHGCSSDRECPAGRPCIDTFCGGFWPGDATGTACGSAATTIVSCGGYCDPATLKCRPFCAP